MENLSIILYGPGEVGRALIKRTMGKPEFKYVAIADSEGTIAKSEGSRYNFFTSDELRQIISLKERKYPVAEYKSHAVDFYNDMNALLAEIPPVNVLVDTTSYQTQRVLETVLEKGIDVVGSNKRPYADGTFSEYQRLVAKANRNGRVLDNRTTVSANLGVLNRVREFIHTGGISHIRGGLSGSMGYISYMINNDVSFSQALEDARAKSYTEPDEREDITGKDFTRKTVIIARTAGVPLYLSSIEVEAILPEELLTVSVDEFRSRVSEIDGAIQERVRRAKANDCTLRYVGEIDFDREVYEVGFKEIPLDDPQANVPDCSNKVTIYPRSWKGDSMSIEGPGAGLAPTSQGLEAGLYDILDLRKKIDLSHKNGSLC